MRDPSFPVFCGLGIALCLLELPWHWKAGNTGTVLYLGWASIGCFVFLVDSLVWAGNVNNSSPIWCNVATKAIIGLSVGITASSLCIQRRLYRVVTIRQASKLRELKRRDHITDLLLGIGLPILVMVLHYVVQPNQYDIVEDFGCWPATLNTLLAIPMVLMWPVLISIASFVYAGLAIRVLLKSRQLFSQAIDDSESGLTMSRYFRLMAMGASEMLCSLPLSLFMLISNLRSGNVESWVSWGYTHHDFKKVNLVLYDELLAQPVTKTLMDLNRWFTPGGAFLFFMYFGLPCEARDMYKQLFWGFIGALRYYRRAGRIELQTRFVMLTPGNDPVQGINVLSSTVVHTPERPYVRGDHSESAAPTPLKPYHIESQA